MPSVLILCAINFSYIARSNVGHMRAKSQYYLLNLLFFWMTTEGLGSAFGAGEGNRTLV